ncbi:MAG: lipoyl(octanoyl) transferase LipB [Planctomycetota bacterium]|jgi:lipoyl(octanoyl) transferase
MTLEMTDLAGVDPTVDVRVEDLGTMAYAQAFVRQKRLQQDVIAAREHGRGTMYVLLVEHAPPVITISRRPGASAHLVATESELAAAGVEVEETDRGGDITYHGPGQLVVYPILDLNRFGLRLHGYMRLLEQVVIDTLGVFGLNGQRDLSATGVWVADADDATPNKVCAMGVRVSRWVTMHGLAINVTTNLAHFDLIVPCGLTGRAVTSLEQLLGPARPSMGTVKQVVVAQMGAALARASEARSRGTAS